MGKTEKSVHNFSVSLSQLKREVQINEFVQKLFSQNILTKDQVDSFLRLYEEDLEFRNQIQLVFEVIQPELHKSQVPKAIFYIKQSLNKHSSS